MRWRTTIGVALACLAACAWARSNSASRADQSDNSSAATSELQQATAVIEHMTTTAADKAIPKQVLAGAKCVAVIPKLIKGAFVVGGEHGTGVATCRTQANIWSPPAPFSVSGMSWGPQIGGKSSDLVMFIMNQQGMNDLMAGHIKVGADVSAAAGPVGRDAAASAGWKAGILTYSSSKGAFIGASLNGAERQADHHAIESWYGKSVPFKDILEGNAQMPNAQARAFVNAVQNAKETAQAR